MSEDQLPKAPPPAAPEFEVWDVHRPAVIVFERCISQWRTVVAGKHLLHIGLDYAGVDVVIRHTIPRRDRADVFEAVQVMESVALPILNEGDA